MFKRIFLTFFFFLQICLSAEAKEIMVSAATSLSSAFLELKDVFESENPHIKIYTNFASSNNLLQQIEVGAPVDIFASADQETMDKASQKELIIEASRKDFLANTLALIVSNNSPVPTSLENLSQKYYPRIALGTVESTPIGRYTKVTLEQAQLWNPLQSRFIFAENVRQVLDYVRRGEVEAGFVYTSDTYKKNEEVKTAFTFNSIKPILYPIAILKNAQHKKEVQLFLDFILSQRGQKIFIEHGFSSPQ